MTQDPATRFGPDEAPASPAHDVFAISMICLACLTDGKNGGAAGSEWVGGVTLREDQISVSHPGASPPKALFHLGPACHTGPRAAQLAEPNAIPA